MDLETQYKIKSDPRLQRFIRENSYWYKYLNRDSKFYKDFIDAYKKYKREVTTNKVSDTISNIDMVANILKVLD